MDRYQLVDALSEIVTDVLTPGKVSTITVNEWIELQLRLDMLCYKEIASKITAKEQ